jgi:NADH-quinone oxidoreductase subunit A
MGQYLPIVALTVLAILFAVISLLASKLLAPNRPNTAQEPPERFPVSFFVVAMLFIMFDIEIIFAYPYAVDRQFLGTYGFLEMVSFSAVFFVAFVYMIARGALDWGPLQRAGKLETQESLGFTTTSSVRVVGSEGRAA